MTSSPPAPSIPERKDDLTPEWLTGLLAAGHPGVAVEGLELLDVTQGAATRVRLGVRYAPGRSAGLPEVMFLKAALTRRLLVADPNMYVTEVRFYQSIRPEVTVETPAVFASAVDPSTGRHALLIEDLSLRGATFPSATSTVAADDLAPLVAGLARFHAAHWGAAGLRERYPWLETAATGRSAAWWRTGARTIAEFELGAAEYKARILAEHPLDRLLGAVAALQRRNDADVATVVHGDLHIGNTYILPEGGGFLDWQLMMVTAWACDVAYLLVTGLTPASREASEVELLRLYLDHLVAAGVEPPRWDEAWASYRAQMVYGILSWLVTPTSMYDEARLSALLERAVTAASDLDAYRLVERGAP